MRKREISAKSVNWSESGPPYTPFAVLNLSWPGIAFRSEGIIVHVWEVHRSISVILYSPGLFTISANFSSIYKVATARHEIVHQRRQQQR